MVRPGHLFFFSKLNYFMSNFRQKKQNCAIWWRASHNVITLKDQKTTSTAIIFDVVHALKIIFMNSMFFFLFWLISRNVKIGLRIVPF